MDFLNKEINHSEEIAKRAEDFCISRLTDLELALIGGGCGETVVG